MKKFLNVICIVIALFFSGAANTSLAQSVWTNVSASTTWLGALNWNPNGSPTNGTEVAQFNGTAPTSGTVGIGINMNTLGGLCRVGAIEVTSARSSLNLIIADSSTTVSGSLQLNGATVNGVANTILRNAGAGTTTLILTNTLTTGNQTMSVSNNLANALIDASSAITIYSIITGNGFTKTGAGALTLVASNLYSGNTIISNGILGINDGGYLNNSTLVLAGGTLQRNAQNITPSRANAYRSPLVVSNSSTAQTTTTTTRTINFEAPFTAVAGTTLTVTNTGAGGTNRFRFYAGGFTNAGNIVLAPNISGALGRVQLELYNSNNPAGGSDILFSGIISGAGTLYKNIDVNPGGNVILSQPNTYTGGTEIRGGFFGLATNNALGFGNVIIGNDPNPIGLYAVGAARSFTNDVTVDTSSANTTNLQINGAQDLTLSGRVLIHSNLMFFTVSNTATTTFSGTVTNAFANALGISKQGSGKLVLSGTAAYSGTTRAAAGTLALSGAAVPNNTTNLTVFGGATLDISALSGTWTLANSQSLQVASPVASATLIGSGSVGLTLGSTSPLVLAYSNGIPSLTVTGGVLTVASGNPATVTVANGGFGLPAGDYKLISTSSGGAVAGTAPTSVTVNGDGLGGISPVLVISNAELYLHIDVSPTPPAVPVVKAASSTNITGFTASWNSASGATGYRLDVSLVNNFSSFVSGYNDLDVGNVVSFAVTGLSPATTYFYQVRATNTFGTSASSSVTNVTTLVAPYLWNAGNGNWSDSSSWQYANVPVNGVSPGFTGAGGNSTNDLSSLLLNSITFSNGAGAYTVSGNGLVVSNGILNNSTAGETISAPLTLGAAQTLNAAVGALNISGPVTNAGNTLTFNAAATSTNSGSISGSGALIKNGAATLFLSGANTYTGATTNNAGNLQVAGGSALPDAATLVLANTAGVTLTVDANETVGSISSGDNTTIALGANNLTVGGDGTSTTNTSAITGTGKLVKTGAGTMVLNKATAYGSSFSLRVEGGTADLNRGGNTLAGIIGSGNTVELAGGTLQLSASLQANFGVTFNALNVMADSTFSFNRTGTSSSQSPLITAPLNFTTNANLSFIYNAQITGGTSTFTNSTMNLLQGNATLTLGSYGITLASPIGESGGSYSLTKAGPGQLNLNAINTYSGNTTNLAGILAVNSTGTFGNGSGSLVLVGGDILSTGTRASSPIANPVVIASSGTNTIYGDSTATAPSTRIFPLSGSLGGSTGTLRVGNKGLANNTFELRLNGGGYTFTPPVIVGDPSFDTNGTITLLKCYNDTNTAAQTFSGVISGNGSLARDASVPGSGGTTILSGANTYSGGTTISAGFIGFGTNSTSSAGVVTSSPVGTATLEIKDDPSVGFFASGAARVVENKIFLNGVTNLQIIGTNELTLAGSWNIGSVAKMLTVNNTGLTRISGVISNIAALTKAGNGTLALTATNLFTGNLTIAGGTLALSGSGSVSNTSVITIANNATLDASGRTDGTFTLNSGQSLNGVGSVIGSVVAASGSTTAPGFASALGALTVSSNTTLAGLTYMKINRDTATNDVLSAGGTLTEGGTLTVTNISGTLVANDTFKLFSAGIGFSGSFATTNLPALTTGLKWDTTTLASSGIIKVAVTVNTNSPTLTNSVTGGVLTLTWPTDRIGWRLQVQTNTLADGLGTNWQDVANSTTTNQVNVTIDAASATVFYRMVYP